MFESTEIVRMAQELARHAGSRQSEIARNVANADTPGYRAHDVVPFADAYDAAPELSPRATRAGHLGAPDPLSGGQVVVDARSEPSPNGNSVSLELEMVKTAEVRQAHGMALSVYKTSLDMMRMAIGRGR